MVQVWENGMYHPLSRTLEHVNCTRWSFDGTLLASAGNDTKINLMDFRNEKSLYYAETSDRSKHTQNLVILNC